MITATLLLALTVTLAASSASASAVNCSAVMASAVPAANYRVITECLNGGGNAAHLAGGIYWISNGVTIPENATLSGVGGVPVMALAEGATTNFVVSMQRGSTLSGLSLDAAGRLPEGCCSAVVSISAANAVVKGCVLTGQTWPRAPGVYFFESSANSTVVRTEIHSMFYGVIFAAGLTAISGNLVTQSTIHNTSCDSVTFAGYGEVTWSSIYSNGFNCHNGNPPIPGGGLYCLSNANGGLVANNVVSNNCGMLVDHDSCAGFKIIGNSFSDPGNTFGGAYPYCRGSLAVNLIDCNGYLVENNTVRNSLSTNAVGLSVFGDPNAVFEDVGAAAFSDLPGRAWTVLGFSIVTRPATQWSTGHVITGNSFVADCTTPAGCVGVGYFAGRGTGWQGAGGAWRPSMFTSNDPFGSDIGSKRCGGNWYAGETPVCTAVNPAVACNEDDYQHGDVPYRNDAGCGAYSASEPERRGG